MRYLLLSLFDYLLYTLLKPLIQPFSALFSYRNLQDLRRRGHAIAPGVRLGRYADIQVVRNGHVSNYSGTEIAPYLQIVVKDSASLIIGARCYLSRNLFLGCAKSIVIGDRIAIRGYVTIIDVNKRFEDPSRLIVEQDHEVEAISVADSVWLGGNVTLLAGTHTVVGAGSFVRSDVPSHSVAIGSPAKVIRRIKETA
ncbi:putative acetyltransferase [compost metagenome]